MIDLSALGAVSLMPMQMLSLGIDHQGDGEAIVTLYAFASEPFRVIEVSNRHERTWISYDEVRGALPFLDPSLEVGCLPIVVVIEYSASVELTGIESRSASVVLEYDLDIEEE